ncbi:MAG TPA: hypothetical protein VM032_15455 [Vicinamibacterales bacterium]|nr:hypothetical protein [Vicinamibacterales bacterium]
MAHLSPGTFIDLLDGTVAESAVPHLSACEPCRRQLAELRGTWHAAIDADVPEPSPLFWDHLSTRVRCAIAADAAGPAPWWRFAWTWRAAGVVSLAAVLLAVGVQVGVPRLRPVSIDRPGGPPPVPTPAAAAAGAPVDRLADDESLVFVADLASHIDWDDPGASSLVSRGDAEQAVAGMSAGERAELQRLLNDALAPERVM